MPWSKNSWVCCRQISHTCFRIIATFAVWARGRMVALGGKWASFSLVTWGDLQQTVEADASITLLSELFPQGSHSHPLWLWPLLFLPCLAAFMPTCLLKEAAWPPSLLYTRDVQGHGLAQSGDKGNYWPSEPSPVQQDTFMTCDCKNWSKMSLCSLGHFKSKMCCS